MSPPLADRIALVTGASRESATRLRSRWPRPARTSSPSRARSADSRSSTTRSRPRAARPPSCRSTSGTTPGLTASHLSCASASAGSMCCSEMRAFSGRCPPRPCRRKDVGRGHGGQRDRQWRLICAMDPLLRLSDAGRAVFISSGVAALRAGLLGTVRRLQGGARTLARTYAAETATTTVRVNLFTPGPIRTRIRAQAFPARIRHAETADRSRTALRAVPAEHAGDWQALRLSGWQILQFRPVLSTAGRTGTRTAA